MSMWLMYLILKLDDIVNGLRISCIISLVLLVITLIIFLGCITIGADEDCKAGASYIKKAIRPLFKWTFPILIISSFLYVAFPTTKQAAAIYFVPKVINNKQIQKMPNKLVELANSWMDEQINSIKKVGK